VTTNNESIYSTESEVPLAADAIDSYPPLLVPENEPKRTFETIKRVAVIFDNRLRPDTTGGYCLRALRQLVHAEHVLPDQLDRLSGEKFDLYINIDDGLTYQLPPSLRPCVLWAIDTHLAPERLIGRGRQIDFVFAAQREGVALLRQQRVNCLGWLPLACDPEIHRPHEIKKSLNICFVAHLNTPQRQALAELIQRHFPNSFIGQCFFEQMAMTYSASRLVVNLSVRNDLNMRVFEAMACGSLLLTDELAGPGLRKLFTPSEHLVTYRNTDELVNIARHFLAHNDQCDHIARAGHDLVLARHTYLHRMRMMLQVITERLPHMRTAVSHKSLSSGVGSEKTLTSIVIPTRNQLPFTRRCLESLREHYTLPYELIVVDNASTDGTLDYLRRCSDVRLIEYNENRGHPSAVNQGIEASRGDRVLLLNNDTLVTRDALERLIAVMDSDPAVGLVGPCSNNAPGQQRVDAPYQLAGLEAYAAELAARRAGQTIDTDVLAGFCLLLRRELVDRVGLFDEMFGIGTYDDYDYCHRAGQAGYRLVIVADAFVHHFGSITLHAEGIDVEALLRANQARFLQKWNSLPHEGSGPSSVNHSMTSIIIVTHNQIQYTRQCLESIAAHTPEPHEIIVVDNDSNDGTRGFLQSQPGLRVIENEGNKGFPAAANQGIQVSSGRQILLLNNDVIVTPGWLGRLLNALYSQPQIGLVGPVTNRVSGPQQVTVDYSDIEGLDHFAEEWANQNAGQTVACERLVGFCLIFRREVVDQIGFLDERFGIGNFEDDDYCRRALLAGFQAIIAKDCFVHHFGSITFNGTGIDYGAILEKSRQLFLEKWNAVDSSSSNAHSETPSDSKSVGTTGRALLSVCMIVRDSSRTLRACLESIRPWVDEIIVVDTGSSDNTVEIAGEFGACVRHFSWCDDFAAARNESLKAATGQWLFWMDSDDTIDATNGQKLRNLIQRTHPSSTMGFVLQVHCPALPASGAYATETVVDHVKVFRNLPAIRFTGRIHEQVLPAIRRLGGNVEWTDIFIAHSGSDITTEGRIRKQNRDLRLLELELADNPDNTFTLFNMGMTLLDAGRPSDALNSLCRGLQLAASGDSHIRKLYALLVQAYSELDRRQTALWTCVQGLNVCRGDPELLFRKGVLEQSLGRLDCAESSFWSLIDRAKSQHFSSVDRGILGVKVWHNLAVLYEQQGKHDPAAAAWLSVLGYDRSNRIAWRGLLDALSFAKKLAKLEQLRKSLDDAVIPEDLAAIGHSRLLAQQGNISAAVNKLKTALDLHDSTELLNELCELTFTHDMLDEAEQWLQKLVLRHPDNPSALHNLASVQWRKNDCHKAVENAKRSLNLRPNYAATQRLLESMVQKVNAAGVE
jgi:GT2 family glycosyltransferase/tetratricopeptide (TPR) repeat protein